MSEIKFNISYQQPGHTETGHLFKVSSERPEKRVIHLGNLACNPLHYRCFKERDLISTCAFVLILLFALYL